MRTKLLALLGCLAVGGCLLTQPGASLITTTIEGIPPQVEFACLVADTPQGLVPMRWVSPGARGSPAAADPSPYDPAWVQECAHNGLLRATAEWQPGQRYAVLTRDTTGKWLLWRLRPNRVKITGENWFLNRPGELAFFLSAAERIEPAPPELLRQLPPGKSD